MINEIKNPQELKLTRPKFVCDEILSPLIPKPFANVHSFTCLVGASRSGKTSLLINMLTNKSIYYQVFENILVIMPTHSMNSMQNNIFEAIDPSKKFPELNSETLTDVLHQLEAYSDLDEHSLLVLDDVTASLKDKQVQKLLSRIIANRRHLKCSIILAVQWWNSIPLNLRKQCNGLILFSPKNNKEMRSIAEEMSRYDPDIFKKICDHCFNEPYTWMAINKDDNTIHKMFSLLEIDDNK